MKFQTASDLHIDRYFPRGVPSDIEFDTFMNSILTPVRGSYLILAGDITRVVDHNVLYVMCLKWCSQHWKHVFVVCGNHEYYVESVGIDDAPTVQDINSYVGDLCRVLGNVHFLNNSKMTILEDREATVVLWGGTLWTRCPYEFTMPIYVDTDQGKEQINSALYNEMHQTSLDSLLLCVRDMMSMRRDGEYRLCVVTHHSPTFKHMRPSHRNTRRSALYATDLEYLFQRQFVDVWIAGHTHDNVDMNPMDVHRTRFLSNCDPEEPTYNPTLTFTL